jgi:outer membrane protein assembly factor BamB
MVTVRLGTTWREDPAVRGAFARGGAAAEDAAASVVDALAIEVDGVDVAAGQAEGSLLAGVTALAEAALRLLGGTPRAQVHFSEGGLELLLRRRGASALLTVVTLSRPARVLARDVEVELSELVRAAREAALALAREIAALSRGSASARDLSQLAARLAAARPAAPEGPPPALPSAAHHPRRRAGTPSCAFEIRDDEELIGAYRGPGADLGSLLASGRVVLRSADGREIAAVAGPPFLALRDLAAFAARLAESARRGERRAEVELAVPGRRATVRLAADLDAGTLTAGRDRPVPCPPFLLARALLEAALDFCGAVAARNPWQSENGWLAELRRASAEGLAHVQELLAGDLVAPGGAAVRARREPPLPRAPLGPGRMKRLAFRRTFGADVGAPAGFGLALAKGVAVIAGASEVLGVDAADGTVLWRRGGARFAALSGATLHLGDGGRLAALDLATGRERWSRPLKGLPEGAPREIARLAGGLALVTGAAAVAALEPGAGRIAWTFEPPAAAQLTAAAFGPMALVASDAGFLYGLEPSGALAWRLRLPGAPIAPPSAWGRLALALCGTDLGGSLLAVDPASGQRAFEVPLDVTPTSAPIAFAELVAVAGTVAGDPVVMAVAPTGRLAWEDAPPLAQGPLALAAAGSLLLAKAGSGACVALARDGSTRWSDARESAHPPAANVRPVAARGIALVPSEGVAALDLESGAPLGAPDLTAPVRLVADRELRVWGMDAEGTVTALRLETHLSVV